MKAKMYFLINNYEPEYTRTLQEVCNKSGDILITFPKYAEKHSIDQFIKDHSQERMFGFGSIQFVSKLQKHGVIVYPSDFSQYDCNQYLHLLGDDALNSKGEFATLATLERQVQYFCNPVFVRPNSCKKSFTGGVWGNIQKEIDFVVNFEGVSLYEFVLFAQPREISVEIRCWVGPEGVITSSQYMLDGEILELPTDDSLKESVFKVAERAYKKLADFINDDIFVVDIGFVKGYTSPKVIEINALSTSGFYCGDIKSIVDATKKSIQRNFI